MIGRICSTGPLLDYSIIIYANLNTITTHLLLFLGHALPLSIHPEVVRATYAPEAADHIARVLLLVFGSHLSGHQSNDVTI